MLPHVARGYLRSRLTSLAALQRQKEATKQAAARDAGSYLTSRTSFVAKLSPTSTDAGAPANDQAMHLRRAVTSDDRDRNGGRSDMLVSHRHCAHAVLFDLDGVLVDSRASVARCINHALRTHGLAEHPDGQLHRFIGPPLASAFAELTSSPIESTIVAACVESYRDRYADTFLRETAVVPGIREALAELRPEHRLAVATSKPRAFAEPLLHALELRQFFDAVAAPDLKVQTEGKAITVGEALGALRPARALMVGDRSFDIAGAHAHGLPAIGVSWGIGSCDELVSAGADLIISAPGELRSATGQLLASRS
jgi:phosphoglycolate phosphatase